MSFDWITEADLVSSGRVMRDKHPFKHAKVMEAGRISGIIVLDFDGIEGCDLYNRLGLLAHRKTPHGYHVDVEYTEDIGDLPGMAVLTNGSCAIVLGRKADGMLPHTWLRDLAPYDSNLVKLMIKMKLGDE